MMLVSICVIHSEDNYTYSALMVNRGNQIVLVELTVVLSNQSLAPLLNRLAEVLGSLEPKLSSRRIVLRKLPKAQGEILRAIKEVLAGYPDGLQTFEVRRLVEQELGRKLLRSTVKDALASNAAFERIRRGRYRVKEG